MGDPAIEGHQDQTMQLNKTQTRPTPTPKQKTRMTYNQVRLEIRGEKGAMGHPVGYSTDRMPTTTYFRMAKPTRASYAESLGKSQAPLGTLGGPMRATKVGYKGLETTGVAALPFGPTPEEAQGNARREETEQRDWS